MMEEFDLSIVESVLNLIEMEDDRCQLKMLRKMRVRQRWDKSMKPMSIRTRLEYLRKKRLTRMEDCTDAQSS